jgi:GH18 family chitinase
MSAIRTQEEKAYHLEFLKEASKVWHHHGLLVSVPLHVQQVLPTWAYEAVDRINLMVYDSPPLPGGTVEKWGNHVVRVAHAHHALKTLIDSGCPSSKIWLGCPLYGTQWNFPHNVQTYAEVSERIMKQYGDSCNQVKDRAQYLQDLKTAFEGYQWDSPSVISEKMGYVHTQKLGGVFVWELGQDLQTSDSPGGLMLMAISKTAKRRDWNFVIPDDEDDGNKAARNEL